MEYTFGPTNYKESWEAGGVGKGQAQSKKIKFNPYIPPSAPPACVPDMPATVLKNWTPKVRHP